MKKKYIILEKIECTDNLTRNRVIELYILQALSHMKTINKKYVKNSGNIETLEVKEGYKGTIDVQCFASAFITGNRMNGIQVKSLRNKYLERKFTGVTNVDR